MDLLNKQAWRYRGYQILVSRQMLNRVKHEVAHFLVTLKVSVIPLKFFLPEYNKYSTIFDAVYSLCF